MNVKKEFLLAAGVLILCALCVFSAGCIDVNSIQPQSPGPVVTAAATYAPTGAVPSATAYTIVGDWKGYLNGKEYSLDCEVSGSAELDVEHHDISDTESKYYGTWSGSGSEYTLSLSGESYTVSMVDANTAALKMPDKTSVTMYREDPVIVPTNVASTTAYTIVGDWKGYLNSKEYALDCEVSGSAKLEVETRDLFGTEYKYYGTWSGSGSEYTLTLSNGDYKITVTDANTAALKTPEGTSVSLYRD